MKAWRVYWCQSVGGKVYEYTVWSRNADEADRLWRNARSHITVVKCSCTDEYPPTHVAETLFPPTPGQVMRDRFMKLAPYDGRSWNSITQASRDAWEILASEYVKK